MKPAFGYLFTSLLAPLAGYYASKYTGPEVAAAIASGVAGVGARILHTSDPPGAAR
jgi:hypothetical protein